MKISFILMVVSLLCFTNPVLLLEEPSYDEKEIYTNTWAVEVDGNEQDARNLAEKHGFSYDKHLFQDYYTFKRSELQKRSEKNEQTEDIDRMLAAEPKIKWFQHQKEEKRHLLSPNFNDPQFDEQWYFNRYRGPTFDVLPVWPTYTGKGVLVAVVDDGVDGKHTELARNYNASASYDFIEEDNKPVPKKKRVSGHGNNCAGVIAGAANNSKCGVGIAYKANIAGLRLFDNNVKSTDATESAALVHELDAVDIYSNSWGPGDMGWRVEGPGTLTSRALEHGAKKGRGGLGSIYTFAAGNGGITADNCAYNGYVNSIYTIAINGVNQDGSRPSYAEQCPGVMAAAFSRDDTKGIGKVITADAKGGCTNRFAATSAATAMASGLIALTLEANPNLSWRDVQHIIARSSRADPLKHGSWITNNAGFKVSKFYGFGLMDAWKMVNLAKRWTRVPRQLRCEIQGRDFNRSVPSNFTLQFNNSCGIKYLEHVQVKVDLAFGRRGDLGLELVAPSGTKSPLTSQRPFDNLTGYKNLTNWVITTLFNWGEDPAGRWTLRVNNLDQRYDTKGALYSWSLIFYGTKTKPIEVTLPPKPTRPPPPPTSAPPTQTVCKDKSSYCRHWKWFCKTWNYAKRNCHRTCGICKGKPAGPPVDGKYSDWSRWTMCSKKCGSGIKRRFRDCNNPAPKNGGKKCKGSSMERQYCNTQPCKVCKDHDEFCPSHKHECKDYKSIRSHCPLTCGLCKANRKKGQLRPGREFLRKEPFHSILYSTSTKQKTLLATRTVCKDKKSSCPYWKRYCSWLSYVKRNCPRTCGVCKGKPGPPVDGKYSDWSRWTMCSKKCGSGIKRRFRSCDNPAPKNGGKDCKGSSMERRHCNTQPCKVCKDHDEFCPSHKHECKDYKSIRNHCPLTCGVCKG